MVPMFTAIANQSQSIYLQLQFLMEEHSPKLIHPHPEYYDQIIPVYNYLEVNSPLQPQLEQLIKLRCEVICRIYSFM